MEGGKRKCVLGDGTNYGNIEFCTDSTWMKVILILMNGQTVEITPNDASLDDPSLGRKRDEDGQYVIVPASLVHESSAQALQEFCLRQWDLMSQRPSPCRHAASRKLRISIQNSSCVERCERILPCGHQCLNLCCDKCGPCNELVTYDFKKCDHSISVKCSELSSKVPLCEVMVENDEPAGCGHIISVPCHKQGTVSFEESLELCTAPCNQTKLCGHNCEGTCKDCQQGKFHVRCKHPCGRTLPCGHKCESTCCSLTIDGTCSCPPCKKPCESFCEHGKCKLLCSTPCVPCQEPCTWECPHMKCTRLCSELCNRIVCLEPCPKQTLLCGCPCIGYCGEICPPLCRECNYDHVNSCCILGKELHELKDTERFIHLPNCGHTIEFAACEGILKNNPVEGEIKAKTCPLCRTVISTCRPFNAELHALRERIQEMKIERYGDPVEVQTLQLQCYYKLSVSDRWNGHEHSKFNQFRLFLLDCFQVGSSQAVGIFKEMPLSQMMEIEKLAEIYVKIDQYAGSLHRSLVAPPRTYFVDSFRNPRGYEMFIDYARRVLNWISTRTIPLQNMERHDLLNEFTRLSHLRLLVMHLGSSDGFPRADSIYADAVDTLEHAGAYSSRVCAQFQRLFLDHYAENYHLGRSFDDTRAEGEGKLLQATLDFKDAL